jgi:predicted DNA-binding transcriptional regulator AlpA
VAEKHGKRSRKLIAGMAAAAEFVGVSRQSFAEWVKLDGFPQPTPDQSGTLCYDIWAIAQWKWRCDNPVEGAGDEFAGADSPHLERKRSYDADIAKIKRDKLRGELVETAAVLDLHNRLASLNRSYYEWLDLEDHKSAANKYEELLDNWRDLVNQFCDSIGESTDDAQGSTEADVSTPGERVDSAKDSPA